MPYSYNTSLKAIAASYIQLIQANVTSTSIRKDIEENAYYPSLLSLSETFTKYRIDNRAFEIEKEDFDELETPYVAYRKVPGIGKDFVLVIKNNTKEVTYIHDSHKPQTVSKEEFLSGFQNIVWFAETTENSGEINYAQKLKEEKTQKTKKITLFYLAAVLIMMGIGFGVESAFFSSFILLSLFKVAGSVAAMMLLAYEIDSNNPFIKNICHGGAHTNCDAVLKSNASTIMGFTWSEIGFYYFISTSLFLLFPGLTFSDKSSLLAIFNALAVPYIIFSIYYQYRVVKQWCPLCLFIQSVLFLELIWCVVNVWHPLSKGLHTFSGISSGLLYFTFSLLIPVTAWNLLKPLLNKVKDADHYVTAYRRFQYNPDIFQLLLMQQPQVPDGWDDLGINIGNKDAANVIIKVCNPFCPPCAKSHTKLKDIISNNSNVQLKIIFTNRNMQTENGAKVIRHLLSIQTNDIAQMQQALDNWYNAENKNYEAFAAMHPSESTNPVFNEILEAMNNWCEEAEVTHTPTYFFNGHRLPENYGIDELKRIL